MQRNLTQEAMWGGAQLPFLLFIKEIRSTLLKSYLLPVDSSTTQKLKEKAVLKQNRLQKMNAPHGYGGALNLFTLTMHCTLSS